ncbi:hypothetical protein TREMEDRAFT_65800 [Tremella mesenterica DSM 1558]|uniref:uncharacterized protein n=1 Tax=Tremella mesenterica (strain ATCC 24925 / CBS 8224 / DSM 1558 / NBRC 9311 / NRRL Y-6157 / RJB 2259-6 / UBC 559-6) TaxID=578456 RepID=UPI00032BE268|nr:uncharacterized protein TREMEDRAFT_65800 [Tremella mesenterica DSM 1558]EIW66194.1 hypothetical protein TREMEDRAFT_65800 [Tremella mesenterica DSM 1558]
MSQHPRFTEDLPSIHTPPVEKVEDGQESRRSSIFNSQGPIPFSKPSTPVPAHDQFAFLGLGAMGKRMAVNLAKHLHETGQPPLIVWNRSDGRMKEFKIYAFEKGLGEDCYLVVEDLKQIGETADIILTSLASDEAVQEVYAELFAGQEVQEGKGDGILPGGKGRSTIFVDTSTIYPTTAGRLERLASSRSHRVFLSCPVFGIPKAAETADVILAISGDYFAKKHVAHALVPCIAKKVMDIGSDVERAMAFKLVGNALELGFVELLAECLTLCDQAGVGSDKLVELIKDQHTSPTLIRYADRITKNLFDSEGGFNLGGGVLDARITQRPNASHGRGSSTHVSARAHGGDMLDWTALVGGQRISAGLEPFAGRRRLRGMRDGVIVR